MQNLIPQSASNRPDSHITFYIIVPIFNVENYLAQCLDSILAQDYPHFKAILINDGSTDNSGQIAKDYANKDNRLIVLHQANSGVSQARNAGLKYVFNDIAWGGGYNYILFVDSDDFLSPFALTRLSYIIASHQGLNFILCNNAFHIIDDKTHQSTAKFVPQSYENRAFSPKEILHLFPELHLYVVWNVAFCCEFLMRESLYFEPHIYFEDIAFMQIALCKADRFFISSEAFYHYRVNRRDSIMNSKTRTRELKATFSHFQLAKIFFFQYLNAKDNAFSAYFKHYAIFYAKETLRHIQFLGYIDEIGFSKRDLKPFVPLLPLKYRFCYHFPRIYGLPKTCQNAFKRYFAKFFTRDSQ